MLNNILGNICYKKLADNSLEKNLKEYSRDIRLKNLFKEVRPKTHRKIYKQFLQINKKLFDPYNMGLFSGIEIRRWFLNNFTQEKIDEIFAILK